MLEQERNLYENMKDTLYVGQFVVIHGDELVGLYETEEQAMSEGVRRFGREPFLVRQAGNKESVLSNPALSLGIIRALSPSPLARLGQVDLIQP